MARVKINSIDDFLALKNVSLGESGWFEMSQKLIDNFADATFDHQWIHVDVERAKRESPCATTIVHGYFILSLLPYLLNEIIEVNNLKQLVNYGIDKMTYKNVIPVNSCIRLSAFLKNARDLGNICKADIYCKFEIEGQGKPALEGTITYLYYFNQS